MKRMLLLLGSATFLVLLLFGLIPVSGAITTRCYWDSFTFGTDSWITGAPSESILSTFTYSGRTYPALVAVEYGTGRAVYAAGSAFSQINNIFDPGNVRQALFFNSIRWVTQDKAPAETRLLVPYGHRELLTYWDGYGGCCSSNVIDALTEAGYQFDVVFDIPSSLDGYDAVIMPGVGWWRTPNYPNPIYWSGDAGHAPTNAEVSTLRSFVENGGGLVSSVEWQYGASWMNPVGNLMGVTFGAVSSASPLTGNRLVDHPIFEKPCPSVTASNDSPTELGNPTTLSAVAAGWTPTGYSWDLGDGTVGTGATLSHTYLSAGDYTATVTASDGHTTLTATTLVRILASCLPVSNAALTWSPPNPVAGEPATLIGSAEGTAPLAYLWWLGDGTTAEGETVTHAYAAAGSYTVTLEVSNACGQQEVNQVIVVAESDLISLVLKWAVEGDYAGATLGGNMVSRPGDVNGDGYPDFILGADRYSNGQSYEGQARLYYGTAHGLSTTPGWVVESNQADAYYGTWVDMAGDVNGDGYDDALVGAYRYSNGQTEEGRVYLYYGSADGLSTTPGWVTEGNQANATYGISLGPAGDVNGDGYADVIVGAPRYSNGQDREGRVYVYYGGPAGLSTTPSWIAESDQVWAYFGYMVSTAGDVNSDGYDDIVIGAYWYDNGQTDEGRAYVYYGSATGLNPTPNWVVESNQVGAELGLGAGTAGDVNGDGYDDVLVGAWAYDNGQYDEGRTYLYYGSSAGLSTTPAWTYDGNQAGAKFGRQVGTIGDVNGDGYSDFAIASTFYDGTFTDEGALLLFLGSPSGPTGSPNWQITGGQASAGMGSLNTAGDLDGDSKDEIIFAAAWYDGGQVDEGKVYIYGLPACVPVSDVGFTWSPAEPAAGQEVVFAATSVGSAPLTYAWYFGDGTTAEDETVTHAYAAAGSYTVTLEVSNACGRQVVSQVIVVAENCTPVFNASFTWTPLEPAVDEPVTFVGSAEGSMPLAYAWDLGDGAIGGGESVTHPYAAPGTYTVVLQVSNACGQQTVSQVVTVHEENPVEVVNLDVKPGSCPNPFNPNDRGVVPVAVLGTLGLDVTEIDPSTVRLQGVAPLRWGAEDVSTPVWERQDVCDCTNAGPDGFLDLTFKFDAQELARTLPPSVMAAREKVVWTLTGAKWDGTPIEGQDCVVLVPPESADVTQPYLPVVR